MGWSLSDESAAIISFADCKEENSLIYHNPPDNLTELVLKIKTDVERYRSRHISFWENS